MANIEIVYFSGTRRTAAVGELIAEASGGRLWSLGEDGEMPDGMWPALDDADAIVFGSPTFMGGPAWQFKKFADETGERWFNRDWQDKLAGGFTTSGSTNGDKGELMSYMITLANQHGMLWVSLGQASPASMEHTPDVMNWSGGNGGLMAIGGRKGLAHGDVQSAKAYGARVKALTERFTG